MKKKPAHLHPADLRALARLSTDAAAGLTDLVEALHLGIAGPPDPDAPERAGGIAPLTYRTIRGMTRLVGGGVEAGLSRLTPLLGEREPTPQRATVMAALNGVWGDYLVESGNPLATAMSFWHNGVTLVLERETLAGVFGVGDPAAPGDRLAVLLHGLCMDERCWNGHGPALARDLSYVPLAVRYNSGRHISSNGRELADHLEALVQAWPRPVAEIALIGHSMGGLVARSACYYGAAAGHTWRLHLRALVCLGAPHHGAPLERGGNWVNVVMDASPYSAPFTRLGKRRSAGITDLRHGSVIDEDWSGRDRFAHGPDERHVVPLPDAVRCYALAATTSIRPGGLRDRLLGDGLVPVASALGQHADARRSLAFPEEHRWVGYGMSHLDLLRRPEVYERLREWLGS